MGFLDINNNNEKDWKDFAIDIIKVIILFIWAILKTIIRKTLKYTFKIIRLIYRLVKVAVESFIEWIKDKDTKEKFESLKLRTIQLCRKTWEYTLIGSAFAYKYLKIAGKATLKWSKIGGKLAVKYTIIGFHLLIAVIIWIGVGCVKLATDLKPTLIKIREFLILKWKRYKLLRVLRARRARLRKIQKERDHRAFLLRGGYRGAMNRWIKKSKKRIDSFVNEDGEYEVEISTDTIIIEDDLSDDETEDGKSKNKAQEYGKKFYDELKKLMDD